MFISYSAKLGYTGFMFRHHAIRFGSIAALASLMATASISMSSTSAAAGETFVVAQSGADCYSVGSRVAAENGGQLVQATAENRGGQTVCRIVVVIPGGNGERPKRAEFVVPAN
ncbi:hypothetical protein [Nitratireductor soli]|uniref:hypothetical protein n=1 Tax=Nitratireductor soli TaxID=1670619 RepID=UPI000A8CDC50|nr:hypothetical protein [Nitratireductor soli]